MALRKEALEKYRMLCIAADDGTLAVVDCKDAATGEQAALLCAVHKNRRTGEFELVPLARMLDGDPYKQFFPPEVNEIKEVVA